MKKITAVIILFVFLFTSISAQNIMAVENTYSKPNELMFYNFESGTEIPAGFDGNSGRLEVSDGMLKVFSQNSDWYPRIVTGAIPCSNSPVVVEFEQISGGAYNGEISVISSGASSWKGIVPEKSGGVKYALYYPSDGRFTLYESDLSEVGTVYNPDNNPTSFMIRTEPIVYSGRYLAWDYVAAYEYGDFAFEFENITQSGAILKTTLPVEISSEITVEGTRATLVKVKNEYNTYKVTFGKELGSGTEHRVLASFGYLGSDETENYDVKIRTQNVVCGEKEYFPVFWGDDFEKYEIGDTPEYYNDIYNSSAQSRHDDWTYADAGIKVEEDSSGNKYAAMKNTSDLPKEFGLRKYTDVSELNGDRDFEISFRAKPNGNNIEVSLLPYGSSIPYGLKPFKTENKRAYTEDTYICDISTDGWINVCINLVLTKQYMEIFVDGEKVYGGKYGRTDTEAYYVTFKSTVQAEGCAFFDDFSFRKIYTQETYLEKYSGVHPRLFYTDEDFENMKKKSREAFQNEFEYYISKADEYVRNGPREYFVDENPEENWMRSEGDKIRFLSFMYRITGEEKYKTAAKQFVKKVISYPSWGRGETFGNKNLPCSKLLVAISCYYDWLYDELSESDKAEIVEVFAQRAGTLASGNVWWRRSYIMNHCLDGASGCMVAAMAVYDVYPEALKWARMANYYYKNSFHYLSGDGANPEGYMYWGTGGTALVEYVKLAEKFYNIDYTHHGYIQNSAKYTQCMTNPDKLTVVRFADYSDNHYIENLSLAVSFNSLCADEYQKKINQWFLNRAYNMFDVKDRVSETLLYEYEKDAPCIAPDSADYPTETYFEEMGYMFSRTSWEDENQSYVAYRCGPALGKRCRDVVGYDPGSSHVHNDVNSPQIYSNGENLLEENIYGGYATASHNTLTLNGFGQLGETGGFDISNPTGFKANPHITKIESGEGFSYTVADATEIYDKALTGLEKFVRHFIYLKPDILIVVDDIRTEQRETPVLKELRFFPTSQNGTVNTDGSYSFRSRKNKYDINPIISDNTISSELTKVEKEIRTGYTSMQSVVRIVSNNSCLIVPTVISWSNADSVPVRVTGEEKDGKYYFYTDDEVVCLDVENSIVTKKTLYEFSDLKTVSDSEGVRAEITAVNNSSENKNITLFVASYDKAGSLANVAFKDITVVADSEKKTYRTDAIAKKDNYSFIAFAWEDKIKPISKVG